MLVTRQQLSVDRLTVLLPSSQIYLNLSARAREYSGCTDQRVFCVLRELEEEIGHRASSWWMVIQGAVTGGQRGTWLPPFLRFLLTSQRAGCLLKISAPSAAKDDSFAMNHFQK